MRLLNTIKRVSRLRGRIAFLVLLSGMTTVGAYEHTKKVEYKIQLKKSQVVQKLQQQIIKKTNQQLLQTKSKLSSADRQVMLDKKQINALKAKIKQLASRSSSSIGNMHVQASYTMTATWYDHQGGINGPGITATGTQPIDGVTVAVDPQLIPLHSKIYVKFASGHSHEYVAQDTGSAIHGDRIDIYDSNPSECFRNGRQKVQVIVIK